MWLSPLLVLRGAFRNGLVPTCSVNFDACEWREASLPTGVRCDNPIPHEFMSTLRCASSVVGAASLVEPTSFGSRVLDLPCLSLDTSRIFGSWSRRAVFAISSTFTTAPIGVDMLRSRVEILLNFEPHQGTRMGVPMCFNVLNLSLRASWLLGFHVAFETKGARTFQLHCTHSRIASYPTHV